MPIMSCSVLDCDRPQRTRSLCGMHYQRLRKHGTTSSPVNTCATCATGFRARSKTDKFCSQNCSNAWNRKSNPRKCSIPECERGHDAKGLCSMHWRRKARADGREANPKWDDRRRANYQKRRAQIRAVPAQSVSPAKVYERDGWVCGICLDPVDKDLKYPDPKSASLDHIFPLSKGGHHTYENTQLGHLDCNVRKNDKIL